MTVLLFIIWCLFCLMLADLLKALQRVELLQSPRHHSMHHRIPYACRFCTYTSILNPVLDRVKFWRGLEAGIGWIGLQIRRGSAEREGV